MIRAVLWGLGHDFSIIWPKYKYEIEQGNLQIIGKIGRQDFDDEYLNQIPVVDIEQLKTLEYDVVLVSSMRFATNIFEEACKAGVRKTKIVDGFILTENTLKNVIQQQKSTGGYLFGNVFRHLQQSSDTKYFKGVGISISLGVKSYAAEIIFSGKRYPAYPMELVIGNFTSISWNEEFSIGSNEFHDYHNVSSHPFFYTGGFDQLGGRMIIGNDVWIGKNCQLKGTHKDKPLIIGDGAVLAADSVVVKDVPPYAIVGGNPAKIIKYRFSQPVIEAMLRIKWWYWPLDKIEKHRKEFQNPEEFIKIFDRG